VHQRAWRRRKRNEAEIGKAKQVLSVLVREKCIHVRRITIVPRMMAGNAQRTNTPAHSCVATDGATLSVVLSPVLTFKNPASYI